MTGHSGQLTASPHARRGPAVAVDLSVVRPATDVGQGPGLDSHRPTAEDLRAALAADDLTVHLRPQMSLADGRTVAVAAVARWEHPSCGMVGVDDLVAVTERAGLRAPLAETVLDLALTGAARWWSHRAPLPVAVAVAGADVTHPDLLATVRAGLSRHGLPPRALTIEVRAPFPRDPAVPVYAVLTGLRALGVAVSVDDDGTAPSGLGRLRRVPADELRLHPALVADLVSDPRAVPAVGATIALAHTLGLRVVAAGVEDTASLGTLARLGCDAVEGRVVADPMRVDAFVRWLRDRPADRPVRTAVAVPAPRRPQALLAP